MILDGKKPQVPTPQKAAAVAGADGIPSAARDSGRHKLATALEANVALGKLPAAMVQSAAEACEGMCCEVRHIALLPPPSRKPMPSLIEKGSCWPGLQRAMCCADSHQ